MRMSPPTGGDHAGALLVLPLVPVVIFALLLAVEVGARARFAPAIWIRRAHLTISPAVLIAALGMAISAAVHLALAPAHLSEDPVLGALFALDGVALLVVAAWSVARPFPGWRAAGVALLVGGILTYAGYVASGAESADAVGIATKLVELAAIALLVLPDRLGVRPIHLESTEV